jgi:5-formyltetrahydrofolate cyclo-ligase
MLDKTAFRQRLQTARKNLDPETRQRADGQITDALLGLPAWKNARTVGCYVALPDEAQTLNILQAGLKTGKILAAPVVTRKSEPLQFYQLASPQDLQPGPMGILQPPRDHLLLPENLDLLIVPGVGFDLLGQRLGYGGGYYDRYLSYFQQMTVALAYDLQVVDRLPATPHDRKVQILLTETRVLHFV